MDNSINTSVSNIENILKETLDQETSKIHKLMTDKSTILIVSQKGKNNSYSFFEPSISLKDTKKPVVTLNPIVDIFDYLEEKKVNMNITTNSESEGLYARTK